MGRGYITAAVRRTMGYPMKGYVRVDLRKPMSAMQNKPIATIAESDKKYPYYDSQGNLKNEYHLSEKAAKDLIDALKEDDGRDLGFDNFLWNNKTKKLTYKKNGKYGNKRISKSDKFRVLPSKCAFIYKS